MESNSAGRNLAFIATYWEICQTPACVFFFGSSEGNFRPIVAHYCDSGPGKQVHSYSPAASMSSCSFSPTLENAPYGICDMFNLGGQVDQQAIPEEHSQNSLLLSRGTKIPV